MNPDLSLLRWVAERRTGWATAFARGLMAVGTRPLPILVVAVVVLVTVAALRWWRPAAAAALAAGAAVVVTEIGKHLVHRPRPPAALDLAGASGWSMPSTDAALTAAAATVLAVAALAGGSRAGRALADALAVLTVVVGIALVYLGAHWATDVLAGWVIGGAPGAACSRLLRPARAARSGTPAG